MKRFLIGLDSDLSGDLALRFQNLWMHDKTESEAEGTGNGEGCGFEFRRKPCGRPLAAYRREVGLFRAIQRSLDLFADGRPWTEQDLLELHRTLMATSAADPAEPVGAWKTEPNGTFIHVGNELLHYRYADPADVPRLMERWLKLFNRDSEAARSMDDAARSYARLHLTFVWIHPFFNGNGRLARLLSNGPVLRAGFPPILLSGRCRRDYFRHLDLFKMVKGRADRNAELDLEDECLKGFAEFCRACWRESLAPAAAARRLQERRRRMTGV